MAVYAVNAHESSRSDSTDLTHATSFLDPSTQSELVMWANETRDFDTTQLEINQAKQYLEELISFLKSFVSKTSFDSVRFEQLAHTMRSKLFEITHWVSLLPFHRYISDQLGHAKHLFHSMCHAAEVFKFYPLQERDHQLIRTIIFINLQLMTYCDSRGEPDFQMPLFNRTLSMVSVYLDFLEESAMELNTTFELRQLLEEQLHDARNRVKSLTG